MSPSNYLRFWSARICRLQFKKVKNLFIYERELDKFKAWSGKRSLGKTPLLPSNNKAFKKIREDVHRKTLDIFLSTHQDKIIEQTIESSKSLVTEVMKFPYAVQSLQQLQNYSQGTVDHSVNVSVLSVYLAMQMGYSHQLILQHVGVGGLLHDIGKPKIEIKGDEKTEAIALKMKEHPAKGLKLIDSQQKVPNEVKMIIAQHHEHHDGTGYPKRLRGSVIYDLARIVSIANVFDELVGDGKGTLIERQRSAITALDEVHYRKFDPQKLEKELKILRFGV